MKTFWNNSRRPIHESPLAIFLKVLALVFLCEAVVMLLLPVQTLGLAWSVVLDPICLAILSTPLLYRLIIVPLRDALQRCQETEAELLQSEEILRNQTKEAADRVKELNCLYAISKLLEKPGISIEEIVRETLAVVPPGWQYPEITCARIVLDGKAFQTDNFQETAWKQSSAIVVDNQLMGALEVCYLEERREESEGPFLKEERSLINDVVERLGLVIGRRRAEKAIWEQAAALEQFNKALEEANTAALAATHAKSEFLANMSHEIRTPMTAILGFAEALLSAELSPSERQHAVQTISRNGKHLLQVVNDVLDLSKIEAGKLAIELVDCSPLRILAEVKSLMRVRTKAKGLNLEVQAVGPVPESIRSDPTRLRQILLNLVGNAVKFTEIGGIRLVVRLIEDGAPPMLQYEVIDTGMGMTADVIEKIFQPFTQADETVTRRFGGTGLGLTICRRLVEALGGEITVESKPGCGSAFRATVPTGPLDGVKMIVQPNGATALDLAAEFDLDVTAETEASKICLHGRILLAEDGPDNQRLISFVLRKAGSKVVTVENGLMACEQVAEATQAGDPIDLVLMDMQMPVMDGYTATRKLRADGFTGPIIALTAHAMPEDREKCLAAGCDDYATKPIQRGQLLAILGNYLPETATK